MGGYVVRGVLTSAHQLQVRQDLSNSMASVAVELGSRHVELKGNRTGHAAYRTIQATTGT